MAKDGIGVQVSAAEWDSMTFSSWLDSVITLQPAHFLLDGTNTSIFSADPLELSFLYTVAYIASAGNATIAGTLQRLIGTGGGDAACSECTTSAGLATTLVWRYSLQGGDHSYDLKISRSQDPFRSLLKTYVKL